MPRQLPVFQSDNSGKTVRQGSRSKERAVLSWNKTTIAVRSGSTSTASTVLPLTSGNRRNCLDRRLRERLRLLAAIFAFLRKVILWLGPRSVLVAPGASRRLVFAFPFTGCLLLQFTVSGLSAVLNLRQQGPNPLNVFLRPAVQTGATDCHYLRCWHFLCCDVTAKGLGIQSKFGRSLSGGKHTAIVWQIAMLESRLITPLRH